MKKYRLTVKDDRDTWTEDYSLDSPEEAREIIARFNQTLRPGEQPRELVDVVEIDDDGKHPHQWEKVNLVTMARGGRLYDIWRCKNCGVTGKRYGLSGIHRDHKFKAKKYEYCQGEQ